MFDYIMQIKKNNALLKHAINTNIYSRSLQFPCLHRFVLSQSSCFLYYDPDRISGRLLIQA